LNPAQHGKFTIKQIRILPIKPFAPFLAAFSAVAYAARWHEVGGYRSATFMAWPDVI
jgi:hypothetical protein